MLWGRLCLPEQGGGRVGNHLKGTPPHPPIVPLVGPGRLWTGGITGHPAGSAPTPLPAKEGLWLRPWCLLGHAIAIILQKPVNALPNPTADLADPRQIPAAP